MASGVKPSEKASLLPAHDLGARRQKDKQGGKAGGHTEPPPPGFQRRQEEIEDKTFTLQGLPVLDAGALPPRETPPAEAPPAAGLAAEAADAGSPGMAGCRSAGRAGALCPADVARKPSLLAVGDLAGAGNGITGAGGAEGTPEAPAAVWADGFAGSPGPHAPAACATPQVMAVVISKVAGTVRRERLVIANAFQQVEQASQSARF